MDGHMRLIWPEPGGRFGFVTKTFSWFWRCGSCSTIRVLHRGKKHPWSWPSYPEP